MIARVAPLLELEPRFDLPQADQLILANGDRKSVSRLNAGRAAHSARVRVIQVIPNAECAHLIPLSRARTGRSSCS